MTLTLYISMTFNLRFSLIEEVISFRSLFLKVRGRREEKMGGRGDRENGWNREEKWDRKE